LALDTIQQNFATSLQFLMGQDLQPSDFVIVGSSALFMLGILQHSPPPADLDVLIKDPRKFNNMRAIRGAISRRLNGFEGETVEIAQKGVPLPLDLTREWPVRHIDTPTIAAESVEICGVQVMNPAHALQSLKEFHRPKDDARIEDIVAHDHSLHL
jgi:hypothetical protein